MCCKSNTREETIRHMSDSTHRREPAEFVHQPRVEPIVVALGVASTVLVYIVTGLLGLLCIRSLATFVAVEELVVIGCLVLARIACVEGIKERIGMGVVNLDIALFGSRTLATEMAWYITRDTGALCLCVGSAVRFIVRISVFHWPRLLLTETIVEGSILLAFVLYFAGVKIARMMKDAWPEMDDPFRKMACLPITDVSLKQEDEQQCHKVDIK